MNRLIPLATVLLLVSGCGRYFAGPLRPAEEQASQLSVNDDGSVTYTLDRLKISVRPMSDAELNRQFASLSTEGAESTNPYTFGDWTDLGDEWTPPRFTVFRVTVSNYQYPKVQLNPGRLEIRTANNRSYPAMSYGQLYEYYQSYWLGRTGEGRRRFSERTDLLRRTMLAGEPIFSGQERDGYVVFPALHDDVTDLEVTLYDVVLRFNYAEQPVETVSITYRFQREVFQGFQPPPQLARQG